MEDQSFNDKTATVILSGGEIRTNYQVGCTVETFGNRTDKRTAYVAVKETKPCQPARTWHIPVDPSVGCGC